VKKGQIIRIKLKKPRYERSAVFLRAGAAKRCPQYIPTSRPLPLSFTVYPIYIYIYEKISENEVYLAV
jgi:hypothetical protein